MVVRFKQSGTFFVDGHMPLEMKQGATADLTPWEASQLLMEGCAEKVVLQEKKPRKKRRKRK